MGFQERFFYQNIISCDWIINDILWSCAIFWSIGGFIHISVNMNFFYLTDQFEIKKMNEKSIIGILGQNKGPH